MSSSGPAGSGDGRPPPNSSQQSVGSAAGGGTSPKRRRTEEAEQAGAGAGGGGAGSSVDGSGDAHMSDGASERKSDEQRAANGTSAPASAVPVAASAATSAPAPAPASASSSSSSSAPAAAAGSAQLTPAQRDEIRVQLTRRLQQVTRGCGVAGCSNRDCVTGGAAPLAGAAALARASQLFKEKQPSCVPVPTQATATAAPALAPAPAPAATQVSSGQAASSASAAPAVSAASASAAAPAAAPASASSTGASSSSSSSLSSSFPASSYSTPAHRPRASSSAAAAAASSSSSSLVTPSRSPAMPSPSPSPLPSPSLTAMLASSTPMAGPLTSKEAPIQSVSAWVAEVDAAKAAWAAAGSPTNDLSFFRPLLTRVYKVFNELACLSLSFRCTRDAEDEQLQQLRQQDRERLREAEAAAKAREAAAPAAGPSHPDAMTDVPEAASGAAASSASATSTSAAATAAGSSQFAEADEGSPALDYESLDAFYESIQSVRIPGSDGNDTQPLLVSMTNGMRALLNELTFRPFPASDVHPVLLRGVIILLENAELWSDPAHYPLLQLLTRFLAALPRAAKKLLVSWMSDVERWRPGTPVVLSARHRARLYSVDRLERVLGFLQQYISVSIVHEQALRDVVHAVVVMGLVHEVNEGFEAHLKTIPLHVPRSAAAPIPLPFQSFYNDAVNDELDLRRDFQRWALSMQPGGKPLGPNEFSFSRYSFILDAASKATLLKYDAQVQQHMQYRESVLSAGMQERAGYLILEVRRSNLVADTMRALANKKPEDYKKPLKIHFAGEKGIDAGGLRKEFFQLIIAELFDARYGMFLVNEETRTFRFNPDSVDSPLEFELIGALLGIAIYNSTILDMRFPQVVYKMLLGHKPTLDDLLQTQPSLARGLMQLLEFKESGDATVESTFARDFTVSYESWGEQKVVELKPDGGNIPVTIDNRHEFVDLYVDYALSKSVAKQFGAFKKGFMRACGGAALKLFRPFELEQLVCGAQEFDFAALEASTHYEDGYTKDSPICKQFWEIVHEELTLDEKKRLLEFTTGSDRVPLKGLASMRITISKQGPDSEQLPTAHTCFNHLLLPNYSSKDKLRRLLKLALQNSKGFGLI